MSNFKTIAFHTLGCKLNFAESSSIGKLFSSAGFEEVNFDSVADYYIINTCSVTEQADKKCRKAVRNALGYNQNAKVIVIGCYAQLKPQEISTIPGVSLVLGAAEKFNIVKHIEDIEKEQVFSNVIASEISEVNQFVSSYSIEDRTRTFLKVQDGCDYKCSFCTIPLARGRSRSGEIQTILNQCKEAIQKGVKEIVLTGVNIGDFGNGTEVIEGTKPKKQALLIDLLKELDKIDEEIRFRISSIEPNLCTNEIIQFVAASKHFMPHFHMPLQSGDNEILIKMRRRYKRELYEDRVTQILSLMPEACIGVDVIVGFPGESEERFQNTFEFLNKLSISYLHVFTYSERANTPANLFEQPVDYRKRNERSKILRILSEKKKRAFYNNFEGQTRKVLFERSRINNKVNGFTDNYIKVITDGSEELVNTVAEFKLTQLLPETLFSGSIIGN